MKLFSLLLLIVLVNVGDSELTQYFKKENSPQQIKLSDELYEISGITFDNSDNIYGHNDEEGIIYQIDLKTGSIQKQISIASEIINADFEDIVYADKKFFMLTSSGLIYSFNENRKDNSFLVYNSGLSEKFNCEGMMFDRKNNSLLIACKDFPGKNMNGFRAVYSYSILTHKLNPKPYLLVSLKDLKERFNINQFHPSAIAFKENSNSYFILSAKGKPAIIEIMKSGKIIDAKLLDAKLHPKPEGILFYKGKLFISDEGLNSPASISIYSKK